jgi:hypothetical protein
MKLRLHELRMDRARPVACGSLAVRAARSRFFAVIVALLFVCGDFARFAHFASVRHRVCAEHGVLEDVAEHSTTDRTAVPAGEHVAPIASDGHAHEHEHCPLVDTNRETRVPSAPVVRACLASLEVRATSRRRSPTFVGFPRYMLAPKHSPPA